MEKTIKLVIVDDHAVVRAGVRSLLANEPDISIVGEFDCAQASISAVNFLQPHVVLLDLRMPGMEPVEAVVQLRKTYSPAKILILTACAEAGMIRDLLRAGAAGYLLKEASSSDLVNGVRAVVKGQAWLHPYVQKILLDLTQNSDGLSQSLNMRQVTLLKLLAKGLSNREIGNALSLTEGTVKSYVSNLLACLKLTDRTQAALYAVKIGLVSSDELLPAISM